MQKYLAFLFFIVAGNLCAQSYQWISTNSPATAYRFEDIYFLNKDTGFAVHYPVNITYPGYIARTLDGGLTWTKVLDSTIFTFRDVCFTDNLHGWVGTYQNNNISPDTNVLYQTVDGGNTWTGVVNLPGPPNAGICGLRVINDSTVYGVGRYSGPASFFKTTDNGITWTYSNLNLLIKGLVDIFFFDKDTGFIVGTSGPAYNTGHGKILYTTDGGNTWTPVYTSSYQDCLGWKISFPSRYIGYCSMQFFNSSLQQAFMKTTDGGITWQDIPYSSGGPPPGYDVEGLGFINDTTGWVGGATGTYFTQNGGNSWTLQSWGNNVNRFRFLSDSVAYCAGQNIYKMHLSPAGISVLENNNNPKSYPNPVSEYGYFEFFLDKPSQAKLSVFDISGKEVLVLFDKMLDYGNQHYVWETSSLAPGVYTYRLIYNNEVLSQKLIIAR
jgi:photosystem II stability/assembly factor-like uncharacterized protein